MKHKYNPITPEFAEACLNLLSDPTFKPTPLFPQAENQENLFGMTQINEDGSCSIEFKE